MTALKKTVAGISIIAASAFGGKAIAQNSYVASNDPAKTEVKSTASYIHEGHTGDAEWYSLKENPKALVICISGGTLNEKYTAEQYAHMLHKMFLDPARTKYPTDVVFFVEETGKNLPTSAEIYNAGRTTYWGGDQYTGSPFIHPYKLVAEIPNVTADHAKKNGLAVLQKVDGSAATLAQN